MPNDSEARSIDAAYASFCPQYYLAKIDIRAIRRRVKDAVLQHGYYPPIASASSDDPPVLVGAQIRKLSSDNYIVANVQWKQYGADDVPSKTFTDLDSAVEAFLKGTVGGHPLFPYGVD